MTLRILMLALLILAVICFVLAWADAARPAGALL